MRRHQRLSRDRESTRSSTGSLGDPARPRSPLLIPLSLLLAACTSESAVTLELRFDCSIAPAALDRLVVTLEHADGTPFEGTPAPPRFQDDVLVRAQDVDADGTPEITLTLYASRFRFRDGMKVRVVADEPPQDLRLRVLGADPGARQIAETYRDGSFMTIEFRRDEDLRYEVPVTCLCLGLALCEGTCEGAPQACADGEPLPIDGRFERLCGDELGGLDDEAFDCADRECWDTALCAGCKAEQCGNVFDDDCDKEVDCSDPDCARSPSCGCPPEDCGAEDDGDPDHDDDEDCDGSVDCADDDCASAARCRECPNPVPEICGDTIDNDCDGHADCRDVDACAPIDELCDNGFDDDCNGLADCFDRACEEECCDRARTEDCSNGIDDDCDHLRDCEDPFCLLHLVPEIGIALCQDFADNDCDLVIDCEDPGCANAPVAEVCANEIDDDCNGLTDCEDDVCQGVGEEADCFNALDDDCDGLEDCFDPDCVQPEQDHCDDGRDNDCDGHWDCSDSQCADAPVCEGCRPEVCSDRRDDDCDGFADCEDRDCRDLC